MYAVPPQTDARQSDDWGTAMRLTEAVIGISQYVIPGVLALGFGEIKRDGQSVPLLSLLWAQAQRRDLRRSSAPSA